MSILNKESLSKECLSKECLNNGWLNKDRISDAAIGSYRQSLLASCPNHVVIDQLFNAAKLEVVLADLRQPHGWQTQKHTYSALYVDNSQWQKTARAQRFVHRDVWQRGPVSREDENDKLALEFLLYLRSEEFLTLLSRIFQVQLTDLNLNKPDINTNYFRLGANDFIGQHADDSPGREVCLLLYLNKAWHEAAGGELVFMGQNEATTSVAPLFNRCVLFDPSSTGSEHWVKALNPAYADQYRFNVTSWYWSE